MTLNDLEQRNSPYFAFFTEFYSSAGQLYVTVVEDRPIMSAKYCLPVPVFPPIIFLLRKLWLNDLSYGTNKKLIRR